MSDQPIELAGYRCGEDSIKLIQLGRVYTVTEMVGGMESTRSFRGRNAETKARQHFHECVEGTQWLDEPELDDLTEPDLDI